MTLNFITLDGRVDSIEAALLLTRTRSVRIAMPRSQAGILLEHGFVELPRTVECAVNCPMDLATMSHSLRKSLRRSLAEWGELSCELTTVEEFGQRRLLDEIYYPILVKDFYSKGRSPFGAHNERDFLKTTATETIMVVVKSAKTIVGAAFFQRKQMMAERLVSGDLPDKSILTGLIYAFIPEFSKASSSFFMVVSGLLAECGYKTISLGRDLPFMGPQYVRSFLKKARQSPIMMFGFGHESDFYYFKCEDPYVAFMANQDSITVSFNGFPDNERKVISDCVERRAYKWQFR